MGDYLSDVRKYDALADEAAVAKIVKYLGVALKNPGSSTVSCSDEKELGRVADKWCGKKLGIADPAKCRSVLEKVCLAMEGDPAKARVTFYYLAAKHLDKLEDL